MSKKPNITVSVQRSGGRYTIHGGLCMAEAERIVSDCFAKRQRAIARKDDELIGESHRFQGRWNWFFDQEA
jgi:hypothetical protein